MPRATAATVSSFGRSAETSLDMKPKTCAGSLRGGGHDLHRELAHEHLVALPHAVHGHAPDAGPRPPPRSTTPQSISMRSIGRHRPSTRTKLSRFVVE
jgi:hypothetical protein